MIESLLKSILIELKEINRKFGTKKLDDITPSLNMNDVVDRFTERLQDKLLQTAIHDTHEEDLLNK